MDSACVALDEFAGAVAATRIGIDASSTIGEISAQKEQLREKYEAAQEALSLVEEDRVDTLTKAWNEFAEAVSQVDEDLTPGEAAASLVEEIDAIESAQNGITDELTCS
jgi:chromosome segregation ATPase